MGGGFTRLENSKSTLMTMWYNQNMRNFNHDNKSGGRRNFNKQGFGGRSPNRPSMHKAICSKCGNECELPFKPSGDKPVFCSKCFQSNRSSDSRRPQRRDSGRSNFGDKRMYEAVCDKCGNKCQVPFQPSGEKPVYCSKCFQDKNVRGGKDTEQYKEQFELVNTKLDKILKLLTPVVPTKDTQEEKIVKETEAPKSKKRTNKTEKKKKATKKTTSTKKK